MKIAALALIAALTATPALAQDGRLTLTFNTGAETGAVRVALFDAQAAYDDGGAPVRQIIVDVAAGQRDAVFENLPAGDYAAKAFHDVDGDGKMATNPFGMPTEPFAFSNNVRGNMGPARWDRAHFAVSGDTAQTIHIK